MRPDEEIILKISKEIIIKFIETGRLSLSSFKEGFTTVHSVVRNSVEQKKD